MLSLLRPIRLLHRTMSTLTKFVAATQAAEPALAGSNDADKSEISRLTTETESYTDLDKLNTKLTPLTYLYNNQPSLADVSLYCHLHPTIASASPSSHPSRPSVLRYFLQIQSLLAVQTAQAQQPNSFPPLDIDISTLPLPERQVVAPVKKDKKPKGAAAQAADSASASASTVAETVTAAASSVVSAATATVASAAETVKAAVVGGEERATPAPKKEKKEKKEKPKPAPVVETGPLPSMIDMRVGKVLDVKRHPDADSLYVESIDVGEAEPRTVCSGLVKYMSEDDIRGATIIVIVSHE